MKPIKAKTALQPERDVDTILVEICNIQIDDDCQDILLTACEQHGLNQKAALLRGALMLTIDTARRELIVEALQLIDPESPTLLNALEKAETPAARTHTETDFNAGRDLAVEMLLECERVEYGEQGNRYAWRESRGGAAQNAWTSKFIAAVVDEPDLLPGFASVLSGAMTPIGWLEPTSFANLTLAETQAGGRGEDGTRADSENDEMWAANSIVVAKPNPRLVKAVLKAVTA
jgi:hypothetical protein